MNIPKNLGKSGEFIPTRQSLLSRLRDYQDHASWQEFFDTYWRFIYSVALRAGLTETEAQDVVQETVISVAKHMPAFHYDRSSTGSFKAWLMRMTRWRIVDQLRRRQRDAQRHVRDDRDERESDRTALIERIAAPDRADAFWDEEWEKNLFEAALQRVKAKVKAKHYQVFDLYVLRKWPISKVTAALGVNVGQVYLAKHRVTAVLKKEVKLLERRF